MFSTLKDVKGQEDWAAVGVEGRLFIQAALGIIWGWMWTEIGGGRAGAAQGVSCAHKCSTFRER